MDFSNPDLKELACLIYETLKNSGINVVLVGGACVSIYSHNQYTARDSKIGSGSVSFTSDFVSSLVSCS